MDQQQIENTIQFLVENQAKFHSDLELMKETVQAIAENQRETVKQIKALAENTNAQIQALTENVEAMRLETREAFDNLIIANESTRNFANEIAKLVVNVSQRVSRLEEQNGKQ
jgi:outer membrane murein-binding lipoprotein Lpp